MNIKIDGATAFLFIQQRNDIILLNALHRIVLWHAYHGGNCKQTADIIYKIGYFVMAAECIFHHFTFLALIFRKELF